MRMIPSNSFKARNPSVELFRCLLLFLIVFGHCLMQGVYAPKDGVYKLWMVFFCNAIIWHVDGFIAISGWYGIRFSWRKFFALWGVVFFYSLFFLAEKLFVEKVDFSFSLLKVRSGWFGGAYLALMLCAPMMNAGVEYLSKSKRSLITAWGLMAATFFCAFLPHGAQLTGIRPIGFGHQSFGMMAFVYVTARTARKLIDRPIPFRILRNILLLFFVFTFVWSALLVCMNGSRFFSVGWRLVSVNHSPLVYGMAIVMLLVFVWHVKLPESLGKVASRIAPSTFGIYLFHEGNFGRSGHALYWLPMKWISGNIDAVHPLLVVFFVAVLVFLIGLLADAIRRCMAGYVVSPIVQPMIRRLDARWEAWTNKDLPQ